ncbi:Uncharacterized protein HZ326_30542, partial [Fusarium oxysporum f. sp. albedinis]
MYCLIKVKYYVTPCTLERRWGAWGSLSRRLESLGWGQPRAPSRCRKQYRERRCRANWLPKVGCRHQTGANAYENL